MLRNESRGNQQLDADEEKEECSLKLSRLFSKQALMSGEQERDNGESKQENSLAYSQVRNIDNSLYMCDAPSRHETRRAHT